MIKMEQHQDHIQAWLKGSYDSTRLINDLRELCEKEKLPQKYQEVLEQVLSRIESSSLFTEESCSFSKKDLAHALDVWLEKAYQQSIKEHQ